MKGFARKVVFSAATLFLLLALVTPAISANSSTGDGSFADLAPVPPAPPESTNIAEEPAEIQVAEEPEKPESPPAPEEEETQIDMPQEEDPMASPDESCPPKGQEKSNGHAYGYLRNLEKKSK